MTNETPKSPSALKRKLRTGVAVVAVAALSFGAGGLLLNHATDGSSGAVPRQTFSFAQLPEEGLRAVAAVTGREAAAPPRLLEQGSPFSFADLVEHVSPAVVTVVVDREQSGPQMSGLEDVPAPFRDFFRQFGGDKAKAKAKAKAAAVRVANPGPSAPRRWARASSSTRPATS